MSKNTQSKINSLRILIIALFINLLIGSCQKSPINGDLDGQWQVVEVSPLPEESVIEARLYYCLYMHTCMLTYYDGVFTIGNFTCNGKSISFDFPNANGEMSEKMLKQYGLQTNKESFEIEELNSRTLILKGEKYIIRMRKF